MGDCELCGEPLIYGCGQVMHVDPLRIGCDGEPYDPNKPILK